MMIYQP